MRAYIHAFLSFCFRYGDSIFDAGFDEVYPCYNDALSAAHKAHHPNGSFCPRTEPRAARHLIGADCNFLPLPHYLASSGFGAMMYIGTALRLHCCALLIFVFLIRK
jgi:hypothetical protein